MKKIIFILGIFLIFSCGSDDANQDNPFLPDVSFSFQLNLNLPQYVNLRVPGGIFVDRTSGRGIKGVIVYRLNTDQFFAYELSDPNQNPTLACSTLTVQGTRASSDCGTENIYEIASFGQLIKGEGSYPLFPYRVTFDGESVFVSN